MPPQMRWIPTAHKKASMITIGHLVANTVHLAISHNETFCNRNAAKWDIVGYLSNELCDLTDGYIPPYLQLLVRACVCMSSTDVLSQWVPMLHDNKSELFRKLSIDMYENKLQTFVEDKQRHFVYKIYFYKKAGIHVTVYEILHYINIKHSTLRFWPGARSTDMD